MIDLNLLLLILESLHLEILPELTQYYIIMVTFFCMNKVLAKWGNIFVHFLEETANVELESFSVSYKKKK